MKLKTKQEIRKLLDAAQSRVLPLSAVGHIDDVHFSTLSLLTTKHLFKSVLATVLGIGLTVILLILTVPTGGDIIAISFFPLIIIGWLYFGFRNRVQTEFMRQFAEANGYRFLGIGDPSIYFSPLFFAGRKQSVENLISGEYLGQSLDIFNYQYTVGSGRGSRTYNLTVFRIDFPANLPPLFLKEKGFAFDKGLVIKIPYGRKVKLEGNFNDYFTLTVQQKFEIEALQIFTPDLMGRLIDLWKHLSVEFWGKSIYIYEDKVVSTRGDLLAMHELAKHLIVKIVPVIERIGDDVDALQKQISGETRLLEAARIAVKNSP